MKFELDKREDLTIFKLEERRLDTNVSAALKSEFIVLTQADGITNLLVDLSHVEFADSTGLSALLVAHRAVTAKGGLFGLVAAQPAVEKLIGISHLDRVLLMYDNMEDAVVDFKIMMEDSAEDEEDDPYYDEDLEDFQSGGKSTAKGKRVGGADDEDDFDADFEAGFDEDSDEPTDDFLDEFDDEDLSPRKKR